MGKTLDSYFYDWESRVLGCGYGTGDEYTFAALKSFMLLTPMTEPYDYNDLEDELGSTIAWLLINILCNNDILEYGSSPRHAWLTESGKELKTYLTNRNFDDIQQFDSDYMVCGPDYCNCGPHGYEKGRVCKNPFYKK